MSRLSTKGSVTGGGLKTVGDFVDDPHVTCLDTFSLNPSPVPHAPGPFESFCQVPADNPHREEPPTVSLAPGIDVCDFYSSSEKAEVWLNDATVECLVPTLVLGWEFYSLLQPRPEGSFPVLLNPDAAAPIELLFGRPPAAHQCPSMLFVIVPAGQQYERPDVPGQQPTQARRRRSSIGGKSGRARGGASVTPYGLEKNCGNLDPEGRSLQPRLVVLCPTQIYNETSVLPDSNNWGLFVGPRHRSLVLLNKSKGRIDVHLLMLFSIDAVFRQGRNLIDATVRLYEPFGTQEQAQKLFDNFDPIKTHCGFTNALIPDHVDTSQDGRDDFRRLLGIWPPSFFVSSSSNNLRFLTPLEAQQRTTGVQPKRPFAVPKNLGDFPLWLKGSGEFQYAHRDSLRKYRASIVPKTHQLQDRWRDGMLQLLGLHTSGGDDDTWSQLVGKFGGCAEVTFAGTEMWQDPMALMTDQKPRPTVRRTTTQESGVVDTARSAVHRTSFPKNLPEVDDAPLDSTRGSSKSPPLSAESSSNNSEHLAQARAAARSRWSVFAPLVSDPHQDAEVVLPPPRRSIASTMMQGGFNSARQTSK